MMHIPTPGTITNVSGIPADLRAIPQWVLWKPVANGKKITKIPVAWWEPFGPNVDAHNPRSWGSFEQVVNAMQADTGNRFGIGLVLDGTGILCIDYDDHIGDDQTAVYNGGAFMANLPIDDPTYIERSIQGQGKHAFYRATLPHGRVYGDLTEHLNIEVYAAQFIAITGNMVPGSHLNVSDGQALVDSWKLPPLPAVTDIIEPTQALGRTIGSPDGNVVLMLKDRRKFTFDMMAETKDLKDRSKDYSVIIGDLDKLTGDPAQIERIIRGAPFFKNGYNREKFEQTPKWLAKQNCRTMLEYWLKQARSDNTENIPMLLPVSDAEKAWLTQFMENHFARQKEVVKQEILSVAITETDLKYDVRGDEPIAQLAFLLEDNIPGNYESLTVPPGVVGEFVNALGTMLTGPRLTYMLPAVLASLSGYLGQTFKEPGFHSGFVNHFIIAGQMNTGKTSTMTVFTKAVDLALSGYHRKDKYPTEITKDPESIIERLQQRIISTRAASVQGLFERLSSLGAATWFADEAESQIELMSSGQPIGNSLKAFYKQTFEASSALTITSLDLSRESSKMGIPDIANMTLPTYWSCTSEVFETIGTKELVDGTYSRVNMIYDERPMDEVATSAMLLHRGLPARLMRIVQRIAFIADYTAAGYDHANLSTKLKQAMVSRKEKEGNEYTKESYRLDFANARDEGSRRTKVITYSPAAQTLLHKIERLCRKLGHDANPHVGKWPAHYQILARTDILPTFIAGVLATVDALAEWNVQFPPQDSDWFQNLPQVTVQEEHLQWAFEFVMHWRMRLFKAWDQGRIAVSMSDDEVVMERQIKHALNNTKEAFNVGETRWVPQSFVVKQAKRVAPFKQADVAGRSVGRSGATVMAHATLDRMVAQGHVLRTKPSDIGLTTRELLISLVK